MAIRPTNCFRLSPATRCSSVSTNWPKRGCSRARNWRRRRSFRRTKWDYGRVIRFKLPLLRAAYERFKTSGKERHEFEDFGDFRSLCDGWLGDYALFMAVKAAHGGEAVWSRWEPAIAARKPGALKEWRARLAEEIEALE